MIKHSIQELKSVLELNPETGRFTWLVYRSRGAQIGDPAGCARSDGYRVIGYEKIQYREHVLVWAFHYGEWPSSDLDHKDGNPANNKVENLRLATKTQNMTHCKLKKSNKVGLKGVIFHQGWFQAKITKDYKTTIIGKFKTAEDAHAAYMDRARELYGEFARAK